LPKNERKRKYFSEPNILEKTLKNTAPIVLVGLPRSGSTLLTRIINESDDHYILNDLYVLQLIDAQNSWSAFGNVEQALAVKKLLRDMVRHRSAVHSPKGIANSAEMTPEQLDTALKNIDALPPQADDKSYDGDWASLIHSVISIAAEVLGKTGWGWNTPQDYHHADHLVEKWPDVRIVFIMRDPRSTLKSYKFYPKKPAANRYHPVAQSYAWRNAARAWTALKKRYPVNLHLVRYEDIVEQTKPELLALNAFLPAAIDPNLNLESLGNNSSFTAKNGAAPRILSPLELWINDSILHTERMNLGFDHDRQGFSLAGIAPLIGTTARFSKHYGTLMITDPNVRKRIKRLLGGS
jgi:hypothetical protein